MNRTLQSIGLMGALALFVLTGCGTQSSSTTSSIPKVSPTKKQHVLSQSASQKATQPQPPSNSASKSAPASSLPSHANSKSKSHVVQPQKSTTSNHPGSGGAHSVGATLITNLMSKTITSPIQGVVFRAKFNAKVSAIDVIDLSQSKVRAMNVKPSVFQSGLFLLEAKNGDRIAFIPVVGGKPVNQSSLAITVH